MAKTESYSDKQRGGLSRESSEPSGARREAEDEEVPGQMPADERVDEASEESFPASDPPAWTSVKRVKAT